MLVIIMIGEKTAQKAGMRGIRALGKVFIRCSSCLNGLLS